MTTSLRCRRYGPKNYTRVTACSTLLLHTALSLSANAQAPKTEIESNSQISTLPAGNLQNETTVNQPQNTSTVKKPKKTSTAASSAANPDYQTESPDIIVTGSHIRGGVSAGSALQIIDRKDIDLSGLGTAAQVLHSLPQNFRGGINEEVREGAEVFTNRFSGATVNLRGLDSDATLVLLNGHRLPSGGLRGGFTDISVIPLAAIERVEVLTDGASAVYGADAVAGVVNFVLKSDYEAIESRARYGSVTEGSLDDYQLSQSIGRRWQNGGILAAYEFHKRDALPASDIRRTATNDLRPFGGQDHRTYLSNPGNIIDPFTFLPAFAIPTNQNGKFLTVQDLIPGKTNLSDFGIGRDLTSEQDRHSAYVRIDQEILHNFTISFDGVFSRREFSGNRFPSTEFLIVPESNPFFVDPFGQGYTIVGYSFHNEQDAKDKGKVNDIIGAISAQYEFADWQIRADAGYGRSKSTLNSYNTIDFNALSIVLADSNPLTAFNPFGQGNNTPQATLEKIFKTDHFRRISETLNGTLIADGRIFSLPGGHVRLALGADARKEKLRSKDFTGDNLAQESSLSRDIYAIFSEISIPIINPEMEIAGARRVDLSLAARMDHYEDIGETYNPKIGLEWSVFSGLAFRATYGTSFRPPNLVEQGGIPASYAITTFEDPASVTGFSRVLYLSGGASDLDNETADSWTIGIDIEPLQLKNLRINTTYFDIKFKDRISSPRDVATILSREQIYPRSVQRNPSQAELDRWCQDPNFSSDLAECKVGRIAAIIDNRLQNIAESIVRGLDINISYSFTLFEGITSLSLNTGILFDYAQKETSSSSSKDLVGKVGYPPKERSRASVSWAKNGASMSIFVNHTDSFVNDRSDNPAHVDDQFTFDGQLAYQFGNREYPKFARNLSISLSMQNIFNKEPPLVDNIVGYDPSNYSALGRFIAVEVRKKW